MMDIVQKPWSDVYTIFDIHPHSGNYGCMVQTLRRSSILIILILILLCTVLPGRAGRDGMLAMDGSGLFPRIDAFGMIEDPLFPSHPAVIIAYQAFRDVYSPSWFEHYVKSDARFALNTMHHETLVKILPSKVAVGIAEPSASYVLVPVFIDISEENPIILNLFFTEVTPLEWKISSLTFP